MTTVLTYDPAHYQQCPVCAAPLGEPCLSLSGVSPDGPVSVEADRPHGGRKLRAGARRA